MPQRTLQRAAVTILSDIARFSHHALHMPLRRYQRKPLAAVVESVLTRAGREYLLIFPRQSGKNEAVAHLVVYLMNILQRAGGNIIHGATGDPALTMAIERLERRLDNPWNRHLWTTKTRPRRRCLGNCQTLFLSTHPSAATRGQTAHWLLVIDETQDQTASHIEAVFTPMRAAYNATALYIGTVRTTSDYLWTKKRELEAKQRADSHQRVFMTGPHQVTRELPTYQRFLDNQVNTHGRHHPIVASEYYLEPIDATGGLFPPERRLLMHGFHPRQKTPDPHATYLATLDVAGEDEAATDPLAQLAHPGRDYTAATIFQIDQTGQQPKYLAVDIFVDHGSKHFRQPSPHQQPPLAQRLLAWLNAWSPAHLVADATGVGQGLTSWLTARLPCTVTPYNFTQTSKAALGSAFVAIVETGRFHYWTGDEDEPLSDGWWFWRQVEACGYELPPGAQFDRRLAWAVPPNHRTDTPEGTQPTHDDRLISAALVAHADQLLATGQLTLAPARSQHLPATDPLGSSVY